MNVYNMKDPLIGKQFGMIVPIALSENNTNFKFYECKCLRCGNIIHEVDARDILGYMVLCCQNCDRRDLTGMRFGKLTAVNSFYLKKETEKRPRLMWHCKCDCGNEKDIRADSLMMGLTKSCGCVKHPDLIGEKYGKLTIVKELGTSPNHTKRYYVCKCECGTSVIVEKGNLTNGHSTSCGSCSRTIDLTGQKFGKLTPLFILPHKRAGTSRVWRCRCDCGNELNVSTLNLRNGHTKSCGCLRDDKTLYKTPSEKRLNHIHFLMLRRCFNPKSGQYVHYGQRGITVCDEWKNSCRAFIDWAMSHGYADNLTIDRIDVNGNYEPNNCRWVTMKVQANNKRNNHFITIDGNKLTLTQWSNILNISPWKLCGLAQYKGDEYTANVIKRMLSLKKTKPDLAILCPFKEET